MDNDAPRPKTPPRAAGAFDSFLRDRKLSNALVAVEFGVSAPTVLAWRRGDKIPDSPNQERIEVFCAKVDDTGTAVVNAVTREVESHVPRGWWKREDEPQPKPVTPYDAQALAERPVAA